MNRRVNRLSTSALLRALLRWGANAVLVITLFTAVAEVALPRLHPGAPLWLRTTFWLATFVCSSPFIFAMLTSSSIKKSSAGQRFVRSLATVLLLGGLSTGFFSLRISALATVACACLLLLLLRRQIGRSYQWFEGTFIAGIGAGGPRAALAAKTHDHLVPWDAHLAPIDVGYHSQLIGKTLIELALRERFGLSIMVIKRGEQDIVSPKPSERLYPLDTLLCFGTDQELASFQDDLKRASEQERKDEQPTSFLLRPLEIAATSDVVGKTIRQAGIREIFDCMVVGIERSGQRVQAPKSDMQLKAADVIWLVGEARSLQKLQTSLSK